MQWKGVSTTVTHQQNSDNIVSVYERHNKTVCQVNNNSWSSDMFIPKKSGILNIFEYIILIKKIPDTNYISFNKI